MTFGLAATYSVLAQASASDNSRDQDSNAKPCVVVFGAVRSPARIALRGDVRLAEIIKTAGGFSERVGTTVQLAHTGSACFQDRRDNRVTSAAPVTVEVYNLQDLLRGDAKANPYLRPGDIVVVAERPPVYVMGEVKRPQSIFPQNRLTLTQAIEIAGGVLPDSKTEKVRIVRFKRPGGTTPGVFTFDLKAIREHHAEDPVLQPYDIIDVLGKTGGHYLPFTPPMMSPVDPPMKLGVPLRVIA